MANMTRPVDELGRIVLPVEIRRQMGLEPRDRVELVPMDGGLLLRKERKDTLLDQAYRFRSQAAEDPDGAAVLDLVDQMIDRLEG